MPSRLQEQNNLLSKGLGKARVSVVRLFFKLLPGSSSSFLQVFFVNMSRKKLHGEETLIDY